MKSWQPTYRLGNVQILQRTQPGLCELCGTLAELRPYGPGNKRICFACGQKDPKETRARMTEQLWSLLPQKERS